jgi:hypothetical protein
MPELIRSFANRLRELVGNRRRAPRYRIRLEAEMVLSISQTGEKKSREHSSQRLKLTGYTRDISESGLAIIVPAIRIGGQYFTDSHRTLFIMLLLPDDVIELRAAPVRYVPLEADATETGYLIGLEIESMSEDNRTRYKNYLETMNAER